MDRIELINDAKIMVEDQSFTEVYQRTAPMWAALLDTDVKPEDVPACLTLFNTVINKVKGIGECRCAQIASYAADTAELAEYNEEDD